MSFRNWFAPLVASGFFGVVAVGCSSGSSSGAPPTDAASEVVGRKLLDDGAPVGDDGGDAGAFDQTTGKTCASDTDCASAGGPGLNACSSSFTSMLNGVTFQLFSTPVCILPPTSPNCDPVASPFCDGPDSLQAPGFCLALNSANPQPGQGICYPKCTFGLDGSKPTGCAGSNVCNPVALLKGPPVVGLGYCASACQADSDCNALGVGYSCQTDIGLCTAKKVTRTKAFGESCTAATDGGADDNTTGACNCVSGASGAGFCSSVCITGGAPCPNGWVCDASQVLTTYGGATLSKANVGVAGLCLPPCLATDGGTSSIPAVPEAGMGADATADGAAPTPDAGSPAQPDGGASSQCPGTWKCQSMTLAGPNCAPP